MQDSKQPEEAATESGAPQVENRQKTFARRALIQAGWAVPAVAMFALPKQAGAASGHADGGHQDESTSGGVHTDVPGGHSDFTGVEPHADGHTDAGNPHHDLNDPGHGDINNGLHGDNTAGHSDIPAHADFPAGPHGDFSGHSDNGVNAPHGDL